MTSSGTVFSHVLTVNFQLYGSIEDMIENHKKEALKLTSASQSIRGDSNTTLNCWPI